MRKVFLVCWVMIVAMLACGPLSPPESCGDFSGTADENLFHTYFESMDLYADTTGSPGEIGPEGEIQFNPDEEISIIFESKKEVTLRACLQERKGGGKILFNETGSFPPGENSFALGSYSKGGYVVRVIVDEALVKNLPFQVE